MMFFILDEEARVDIVRDETTNNNYLVLDVINIEASSQNDSD